MLADKLCGQKFFSKENIETFINQIDDDKSNTITYRELLETLIKNLDIVFPNVEPGDTEKLFLHLKK